MSELRWILIGFGAVLLVGIYVWGRRSDRQGAGSADGSLRVRPEPQVPPTIVRGPEAVERIDGEPQPLEPDSLAEPRFENAPMRAARGESFTVSSRSEESQRRVVAADMHRGRVEPTFSDYAAARTTDVSVDQGDEVTEELSVHDQGEAPTLSMSSTPPPRHIERRKIVALRLAAPAHGYPGMHLRQALEAESLQYGKYEVFHRLHEDGASVFSVASMVEPGTFDLERMAGLSYSGITLFAQLPGPLVGVQVLQDLIACGKRLQQALGGTLQDERGVTLTVHRIDRLRQEIVEFERGQPRERGSRSSISPAP
jgi:cell division protein ZipA